MVELALKLGVPLVLGFCAPRFRFGALVLRLSALLGLIGTLSFPVDSTALGFDDLPLLEAALVFALRAFALLFRAAALRLRALPLDFGPFSLAFGPLVFLLGPSMLFLEPLPLGDQLGGQRGRAGSLLFGALVLVGGALLLPVGPLSLVVRPLPGLLGPGRLLFGAGVLGFGAPAFALHLFLCLGGPRALLLRVLLFASCAQAFQLRALPFLLAPGVLLLRPGALVQELLL